MTSAEEAMVRHVAKVMRACAAIRSPISSISVWLLPIAAITLKNNPLLGNEFCAKHIPS